MRGYHYTAADNYKKIMTEGLIPYENELHKELIRKSGAISKGIWIYENYQLELSHRGCILWQSRTKKTDRVVLLEVIYNVKALVSENGTTLSIKHDLYEGNFFYHRKEPARLLYSPVSPSNLSLIGIYKVSTDESIITETNRLD